MGRGSARRRGPVFQKVASMETVELKDREALLQSVRELWCGGCGYGVVVRRDPPACPMCRAAKWRERPRAARHN